MQGFGNVAQYAIRLYHQLGGTVICVSSWDQEDQTSYAFRKATGVDLEELRGITDRFGGIDKTKAKAPATRFCRGRLARPGVDILIPAALENQITGDNVGKIPARSGSSPRGPTARRRRMPTRSSTSAASS